MAGSFQLHEAAENGDTKAIESLIAGGANVNMKDYWEYTPLHWAAQNGHIPAMEALLKHGADINAKNNRGETPLETVSSFRMTAAEVEEKRAWLRAHGGK
jgi:ankyrin repeat protein